MDSQTAAKRTMEEVESLTGCPVRVVQDSSVKYMAILRRDRQIRVEVEHKTSRRSASRPQRLE